MDRTDNSDALSGPYIIVPPDMERVIRNAVVPSDPARGMGAKARLLRWQWWFMDLWYDAVRKATKR